MGIIDSKSYELKCNKCNSSETFNIFQYGSSYGANWQQKTESKNFNITWDSTKNIEPQIKKMTCKKCNQIQIIK
jgi:DNA-directed RNA polymerase subunit M/transcription elongation factor TFIIS